MKIRLLVLCLIAMMFASSPGAWAQTPAPAPAVPLLSVETGAALYGNSTPHFAGDLGVLVTLDSGKTFSISNFEMRGDGTAQPITTFTTGIVRQIACTGKLCMFATAQGGPTASSTETSGEFNTGGALSYSFNKNLSLVGYGEYIYNPTAPGQSTKVKLMLRFTPTAN